MSERIAFLPEMAENQAFKAIFLETIKMSWSANGVLDQLKSGGFGTENAKFCQGAGLWRDRHSCNGQPERRCWALR